MNECRVCIRNRELVNILILRLINSCNVINGFELLFSSVAGKCWPSIGQAEKLHFFVANTRSTSLIKNTHDQNHHLDICVAIHSLISVMFIKYFIFIKYIKLFVKYY